MAVTLKAPNKIHLWGDMDVYHSDHGDGLVNFQATEAIIPGHLVETFASGGDLKCKKNATSGEVSQAFIALNFLEDNRGIATDGTDSWASGETVRLGLMHTGCCVYGLIASGQNIAIGDYLESAGDGTFQEDASGAKQYLSLDAPGAVTALTRLRVLRVK